MFLWMVYLLLGSKLKIRMKKQEASQLIKKNKIKLIGEWEKLVRAQIKVAENTYQASLVDTLPVFLDGLADSLDFYQSKTLATDGSSVALAHGGERARLTAYAPEHIAKEYQLLRLTVCQLLREHDLLTPEINELITLSIEEACVCSCRGFFETFMSLREHFMLTLSHDLRSPLSMATVATQFLLKDPGNQEKVSNLGGKVLSSLERIDKMIQSLLDTSRLKMGEKISLNMKCVDLITIVKEVIAEFSLGYPDKLKLLAPSALSGIWDPDALKRVFENLITNAIKYGSHSTPVTIKIDVAFEKAVISIHNEGSFISEEEQKRLFSLFKRLSSKGETGPQGWGIGLLVVKGIVEGHGGVVSIDSQEDTGTTFIIDIPLNARKATESMK